MFDDYEQQQSSEESEDDSDEVDYTGLKILASVIPVFLLFIFLGRAEMGFAVSVGLGMIILAVKLQWEKRRYIWFWATIVVIFALHIPLFLIARVPKTKLPTLGLSLPIGVLDFAIIWGALRIAEAVFSKRSSSSDHEQSPD